MYNYNSTKPEESQEASAILKKAAIKRMYNQPIIDWLYDIGEPQKAAKIAACATYIGITNINGYAQIVKSNFCRERLCQICAWRRQSKFVAQMFPIIEKLSAEGYRFIECVLTIRNPDITNLKYWFDKMLEAFQLLSKSRKIKRAWKGFTRSIEITYNHKNNTFHPHIHMLICVDEEYFYNENMYISQEELTQLWAEKLGIDYTPDIFIKVVSDECVAAVENLKYSLKPSSYIEALQVFHTILKGRRLISFNGIFAKMRKEMKYCSIDDISDDEITVYKHKNITYNLYKFDSSGGVYRFYETYKII